MPPEIQPLPVHAEVPNSTVRHGSRYQLKVSASCDQGTQALVRACTLRCCTLSNINTIIHGRADPKFQRGNTQ